MLTLNEQMQHAEESLEAMTGHARMSQEEAVGEYLFLLTERFPDIVEQTRKTYAKAVREGLSHTTALRMALSVRIIAVSAMR